MPAITEQQLELWTHRASRSETERRESTERRIREAVYAHPLLSGMRDHILVYAKGSYANNTNVSLDSDVDVAVEYTNMIRYTIGDTTTRDEVARQRGLHPYSGPFRTPGGRAEPERFKDAVGEALQQAFPGLVSRSNKVFTVRESTTSLAADVVPCTTYRHYLRPYNTVTGIRLLPDREGPLVVNYPAQHLLNGRAKNDRTGRRFKRVVRILKNLENKMVEEGQSVEVASYLIESLAYNVPDEYFSGDTWSQSTWAVLRYMWDDTALVTCEQRLYEVNGIRLLFDSEQKWTREEARAFIQIALIYLGQS